MRSQPVSVAPACPAGVADVRLLGAIATVETVEPVDLAVLQPGLVDRGHDPPSAVVSALTAGRSSQRRAGR